MDKFDAADNTKTLAVHRTVSIYFMRLLRFGNNVQADISRQAHL